MWRVCGAAFMAARVFYSQEACEEVHHTRVSSASIRTLVRGSSMGVHKRRPRRLDGTSWIVSHNDIFSNTNPSSMRCRAPAVVKASSCSPMPKSVSSPPFPRFPGSVVPNCKPKLIVRWPGPQEEGTYDYNVEGEPELSNLDESMFFDIDQIPLYLNRMDTGARSQPHARNAEDESHGPASLEQHSSYESTPDDTSDDLQFLNGTLSPSISNRPPSPPYRDLTTLSHHFLHTIPPSVLYDGDFERLEPIFERCRFIPCIRLC